MVDAGTLTIIALLIGVAFILLLCYRYCFPEEEIVEDMRLADEYEAKRSKEFGTMAPTDGVLFKNLPL